MGTTPIYSFPYPDPSDLVANYPALGQDLAEDVETVIAGLGAGLNIIEPTTIANSGGTATASGGQVTFTTVNSVSLNGVFSATYNNYLMIVRATGSGAAVGLSMRLRVSGSDNSTTSYNSATFRSNTVASSTQTLTATSFASIVRALGTGSGGMSQTLITDPFAASATHLTLTVAQPESTVTTQLSSAIFTASTSFDGFSLFPESGTATGTVTVYGYQKT
jgi:hypothetical protein